MGIRKPWSEWSKDRVQQERNKVGAYELGDRDTGEILYIGSGKILSRLMTHLSPGKGTKPGVGGYRVEYKDSRKAARGRERRLLFDFRNQHGRVPKFNSDIPPAL